MSKMGDQKMDETYRVVLDKQTIKTGLTLTEAISKGLDMGTEGTLELIPETPAYEDLPY